MLMAASALIGYGIEAKDGHIGAVDDVLFDDRTWRVRWLVVNAGSWLTGRKVLIHPSAIGHADYAMRELPVGLTKEQVKSAPAVGEDRPVSQQMEHSLYDYYGWDPVWGGSIFGGGAMSQAFASPYLGGMAAAEAAHVEGEQDEGDPHLRSVNAVTGYHIHAKDGSIGHVGGFLVDDEAWGVRYMIVDTRNWWPGKHVLISPYAVKDINWPDRTVTLDVSREQIKASPAWDPAVVVDRDYEQRLHGHYSWPGYGW